VTVLASGMASHAGVSRLMYVMGRDGVFPEKASSVMCIRNGAPRALNVCWSALMALSAITFDLVTATALINFGALVAFTFVNLSVISQFYIRDKLQPHRSRITFHYLILPVIRRADCRRTVDQSGSQLNDAGSGLGRNRIGYLACIINGLQ
jgi:amino acid transporter